MISFWVLLALLSAFSLATSDALSKKALEDSNEYLTAWFRLIFTLPLLLLIFFSVPIPRLDNDFFKAFIISLPFELLAIVLYIKALKSSPLSLTLPFLALTPVFLIFFSYFILGEKVSVYGGAGILLIASGSYLLNINAIRKGILAPMLSIKKEKGSILMICVAFLYSITSSFGKMAIEHSSPLFFGTTYFFALTIFFTPIALWKGKDDIKNFMNTGKFKSLFLPGIFYSIMVITHMTAMHLTKVAYMISVKRTSLLIGVFYGYIIFKEKNIKNRALGAILMFIGFIMVVNAE